MSLGFENDFFSQKLQDVLVVHALEFAFAEPSGGNGCQTLEVIAGDRFLYENGFSD